MAGALFIDYNTRQVQFLLILAGNQFLLSLIQYFRSNISGLHLFKTDSILSILDRSLMIIIVGYLLIYHRPSFKIEWLIYSQSASYMITAVIAFVIIKSKSIGLRLNFNFKFFLVILRKSYPYALLVLLMTSYTRIDSVMIERLLPDGKIQAGIYAHGFRILDAFSQYAVLFSVLLLPMFSKMLINKEKIAQLVKISFLLLVIPAIIFAINAFFYKTDIIYVLYNEHIIESGKVFGILILGFIPIAISYIFGTLLTANGNLKELNIMAAMGVVLNLILNFVLIPNFKSYGAALASLITQSIAAALQMIIAMRVFGFRPNLKIVLIIGIFIIWVIIGANVSDTYVIDRPTAFVSSLIFATVSAFAFKLIDLKALYQILRYDKE
jgi:O-antigen/teichoic acid export membrane protein